MLSFHLQVDLGGANASPSVGLLSSQADAEASRSGPSLQVLQAPVSSSLDSAQDEIIETEIWDEDDGGEDDGGDEDGWMVETDDLQGGSSPADGSSRSGGA